MECGYEIQRKTDGGFGRVSALHHDSESALAELLVIQTADPKGIYRIVKRTETVVWSSSNGK